MGKTSIEWTQHSINPIRARLTATGAVGHYCEKISAGCTNCYSSRFQLRRRLPEFGAGQHRKAVELFLDDSKLEEVLRRKAPTTYFWCDMTDLFGEWVPDEWAAACFGVMAATPQHTHQVLTKRADRMRRLFQMHGGDARMNLNWCINAACSVVPDVVRFGFRTRIPAEKFPLPNVWLGVSVENQEQADKRIPELLRTPAAVRFVSAEPLLGPIDLTEIELPPEFNLSRTVPAHINVLTDHDDDHCLNSHAKLDWVIVGGESGPKARPCNLDWVRSIVRQCKMAGTYVFVKQLGTRPVVTEGPPAGEYPGMVIDDCGGVHLKNRKGADPAEWIEDLRVRELPA